MKISGRYVGLNFTDFFRKKLVLTWPASVGCSVGIVRLRTKGRGVIMVQKCAAYVSIVQHIGLACCKVAPADGKTQLAETHEFRRAVSALASLSVQANVTCPAPPRPPRLFASINVSVEAMRRVFSVCFSAVLCYF
jgi:hypothetical protein